MKALALAAIFLAAPTTPAPSPLVDDSCQGPSCWPDVFIVPSGDSSYSFTWYSSIPGDSQAGCEGPCIPCAADIKMEVTGFNVLHVCTGNPPASGLPTYPQRCYELRYGETEYFELQDDCGVASGDANRTTIYVYDNVGGTWTFEASATVTCSCDG